MTRPFDHIQTWALLAMPATAAGAFAAAFARADRLALVLVGVLLAIFAARKWHP
jgi:hypothetical protein